MTEDQILIAYAIVVGLCALIGFVVVPWFSERAHRRFTEGIAEWRKNGGRL